MKRTSFRALAALAAMLLPLSVCLAEEERCEHPNWTVLEMVEATCHTGGKEVKRCPDCGQTRTRVTPPLEHDWAVIRAEAATCEQPGINTVECTRCGEQSTETAPATGHSWETIDTVDPTCVGDGQVTHVCANCGETRYEAVPATGHDWQVIREEAATCTEDGTVERRCAVCGLEETVILKAEDSHAWQEAAITPATCAETGSRVLKCEKCGLEKVEDLPVADSHAYGEWAVAKQPTQYTAGVRERICTLCGSMETEAIRPTGGKAELNTFTADNEVITVYTTANGVNLRRGPSKKTDRVEQVAKKDTELGILQEAVVDSDGVVWYKVLYKNKTGYVTRDYARLVIGTPRADRAPAPGEDDLGGLFLKSAALAARVPMEGCALYGDTYVEKIEVTGEGVPLWGVSVGDDIADARKALAENGLWQAEDNGDTVIFEHVCSPDSLFVTDAGFDALLTVSVTNGKVSAMTAEAYAR